MTKIVCVLLDKSWKERLEAEYRELHGNAIVVNVDRLDLEKIGNDSKVICDVANITDIDSFCTFVEKKGADNVVLLVDKLNDNDLKKYMFTGVQIHYKNSPIYSLIQKLEGMVSIERVKEDIENHMKKEGQKYIAITSPAGGVGKTTLSLYLSNALASKGKKILLVDLSVYSDIAAKLNIEHKNGFHHFISSVLQDKNHVIDEKFAAILKNNIYCYEKRDYSFDILYGIAPIQAEKIDSDAVEIMMKIIQKYDYDIVIFDTGSSMSEMSLATMECMDMILVVSQPDIGNGWKIIQQKELLECIQVTKKCRLVINKYSVRDSFSCKLLENELQYPLIGVLPKDEQLLSYANTGNFMIYGNQKVLSPYINYIANQIEPLFQPSEIKMKKINR